MRGSLGKDGLWWQFGMLWQEGCGFNSWARWSVHTRSPCVCVDPLLEAPGTCTPNSLTDNSKLSVGVSVSADGCLSQRGPAMNRRLVPSVTPPSPQDSWDGRQHPCDPECRISGDGHRMDVV